MTNFSYENSSSEGEEGIASLNNPQIADRNNEKRKLNIKVQIKLIFIRRCLNAVSVFQEFINEQIQLVKTIIRSMGQKDQEPINVYLAS